MDIVWQDRKRPVWISHRSKIAVVCSAYPALARRVCPEHIGRLRARERVLINAGAGFEAVAVGEALSVEGGIIVGLCAKTVIPKLRLMIVDKSHVILGDGLATAAAATGRYRSSGGANHERDQDYLVCCVLIVVFGAMTAAGSWSTFI